MLGRRKKIDQRIWASEVLMLVGYLAQNNANSLHDERFNNRYTDCLRNNYRLYII